MDEIILGGCAFMIEAMVIRHNILYSVNFLGIDYSFENIIVLRFWWKDFSDLFLTPHTPFCGIQIIQKSI